MRFLFFLLLCLPLIVTAKDNENEQHSGDYIDTNQWHFSIAIGFGNRDNPLADGDENPLFIYPDIAYYGERFYFDNGDFGYNLIENSKFSINWLTHLNSEKYYFLDQLPGNLVFPPNSLIARPELREIPKRKYAVDSGIDVALYLTNKSLLRFQAMVDVSGVYKGSNTRLEYLHQFKEGKLNYSVALGLSWKSKKLVDYYYGLDLTETENDENNYNGVSAYSPFIKFNLSYPISENWTFVSFAKHESIGDGIEDSPLIDKSSINSFFIGASYEF